MNSEIQKLWQEHLRPFPKGYAGEEIDGIDLALLDTETAGCIYTYVTSGGRLDSWRTKILQTCFVDLIAVTEKLDGNALDYFNELKIIAELVLQEIGNITKNDRV